MPVGINTDIFDTKSRTEDYESYKNKVLFLGRIAPIKNPHIFVEALGIMNKKGITFEANIYGDPLPKDEEYHQSLKTAVKELDLNKKVKFFNSISNDKTPEIYSSHEIFVNLSPSGSFDKTILEAAACGCVIIIANQSLKGEINGEMITKNLNPESVSERIEFWLKASEKEKKLASKELQKYVLEKHSLKLLITNLSNVILI
jgi:glycosyltransferase involved in cell wall biosynthesis